MYPELRMLYNRLVGLDPVRPDDAGDYVFHTFFDEEFRGATPEEVVEALYRGSKQGMGDIGFEDWWAYQKALWGSPRYLLSVPPPDEEGAHRTLLEIMVKTGALEAGPLPVKQVLSEDRGFSHV